VVFAASERAVYKLNASTLEVLDSYTGEGIYIGDGKLRSELYLSKGWLFVWGELSITKLNASNLSAPIATLDLRYGYYREVQNVVIDEARQLAYTVSENSNELTIIDVVTMNVTARFNFTSEMSSSNETGADSMVYDARRKVLWYASKLPSPCMMCAQALCPLAHTPHPHPLAYQCPAG
jgi:hypothetical protein